MRKVEIRLSGMNERGLAKLSDGRFVQRNHRSSGHSLDQQLDDLERSLSELNYGVRRIRSQLMSERVAQDRPMLIEGEMPKFISVTPSRLDSLGSDRDRSQPLALPKLMSAGPAASGHEPVSWQPDDLLKALVRSVRTNNSLRLPLVAALTLAFVAFIVLAVPRLERALLDTLPIGAWAMVNEDQLAHPGTANGASRDLNARQHGASKPAGGTQPVAAKALEIAVLAPANGVIQHYSPIRIGLLRELDPALSMLRLRGLPADATVSQGVNAGPGEWLVARARTRGMTIALAQPLSAPLTISVELVNADGGVIGQLTSEIQPLTAQSAAAKP